MWARQYEWRCLSPLEEQAWFVFFSEIGRRMGIQSIPLELRDLVEWAEVIPQDSFHLLTHPFFLTPLCLWFPRPTK